MVSSFNRRSSRNRWFLPSIVAFAIALSLSSCGSYAGKTGSPRPTNSNPANPVRIDSSTISTDVSLSADATVDSSLVTFKYKLTNDSANAIWAVHPSTVSALPDGAGGVIAAMAFFPVREDLSYAQPPYERVTKLEPKQSVEGKVLVNRPFTTRHDVKPGADALPSKPTSVRLCIGYVDAHKLPANQPEKISENKYKINRDTGYQLQKKFACSSPTPLN